MNSFNHLLRVKENNSLVNQKSPRVSSLFSLVVNSNNTKLGNSLIKISGQVDRTRNKWTRNAQVDKWTNIPCIVYTRVVHNLVHLFDFVQFRGLSTFEEVSR